MGQSLTIKNNYVSAPSAPIQHDRDPVAMLFHWAETRPKSTYLRQPINGVWREYSWAEVADQVRRMASALQAMGLKPGEVVALTGKNTAHWIIADLAISMVGGISVGIYPNQASETTRYVLEHSETKFLFFGPLMDAQQLADGIRSRPSGSRTRKSRKPITAGTPCSRSMNLCRTGSQTTPMASTR